MYRRIGRLKEETMSNDTKNQVTNTTAEIAKRPGAAARVLLESSAGFRPIEAMEKAGQTELVASDVLPVEMRQEDRAALEKLGVVFGEKVEGDPLFMHVTLPAGWSKRATNHDMWSDLVDAEGTVVASIFYKAAFYDRSAHLRFRGPERAT